MEDDFLKVISAIIGVKRLRIIRYLLAKRDSDNFVFISIKELCEIMNVSKPTAINTIKELQKCGIFERLKNGLYRFKL